MAMPVVGSRWLDRRTDLPPDWRRVVEVTAVTTGYIHGVGWPQRHINGAWVDEVFPGSRRKTRILLGQFVRRFNPLGES